MQTFLLGQLQLSILDDGTWSFPVRHFFSNVSEAVWRLEVDVDPEGKIPVGHNYGLVKSAT